MGTISSSVGLISGLDIQSLVTQLMAIESRPLQQLQKRIAQAQTQQTAYMELNALFLSAKSAIHTLVSPSFFRTKLATSSNEDVLTVSAESFAPAGVYSFAVKSLATTNQLVSSGFADRNSTPIGAGTLTFAFADARVDTSTRLADLNGFEGIRRGVIRITDRSGASADIDLTAAIDVNDILEAINSQMAINVEATVRGDQIEIGRAHV